MDFPTPADDGLRRAAFRGASWTTLSGIVIATLQVVQLVVLARLLQPDEFGIFAATMIPITIAQVFSDVGMSSAIIQRQDVTHRQLSSLYWLNVLMGLGLYLLMLLATPIIVPLAGVRELYYLIPMAGFALVIAPFGHQFQVLMQKQVEFRRVSLFEMSGAVVGATVSIAGAVALGGPVALVLGFLANVAVRSGLLVLFGWRAEPPMLWFSLEDVRSFLGFAAFQLGERVVTILSGRLDQVIVGSVLGLNALGLFNVASNLTMAPLYKLLTIFNRVIYPVLARLQTDRTRQARSFESIVSGLAFIGAPIMIGLMALSQSVVPVVLGDAWFDAVNLIRILTVVALVRILMSATISLLLANGRANFVFYWTLGWLVVEMPAIFVGSHVGGLDGAAWGIAVAAMAGVVGNLYLVREVIGLSPSGWFRCIAAPLAAAGVMGALVFEFDTRLNPEHELTGLLAAVAVGVLSYGVLTLLFQKGIVSELREVALSRQGPAGAGSRGS